MLLYSPLIDRALKQAAIAHRRQNRKGTDLPYISHPTMVGMILQRAGFDDETIAAAILHDVIEDTEMPIDDLERDFGPRVADLVNWLSETKKDAQGVNRSWEVRKQDHFEKLQRAPTAAKAIALADKLHNLQCTLEGLNAGLFVWSHFNAPKDRWLWNAARIVEVCAGGDSRLQPLADECRAILAELTQR